MPTIYKRVYNRTQLEKITIKNNHSCISCGSNEHLDYIDDYFICDNCETLPTETNTDIFEINDER